ncbi:MAG: choice-of-anchor D domain-containing protein, partial [Verrucomicrobiales bacterium]
MNDNFDTGVANTVNDGSEGDNLPTEPAGLLSRRSTRRFNTPPLFGIRLTAPYFHDASAATLTDAVRFYETDEFVKSDSGSIVGAILAANKPQLTRDLVAFLESLVDLPITFTRQLEFGRRCSDQTESTSLALTISNRSGAFIAVTNLSLTGSNASDVRVMVDGGVGILAPGAVRSVTISYIPTTLGRIEATLEFAAVDTNQLGAFSFGTALRAERLDNTASIEPGSVDFGSAELGVLPTIARTLALRNSGSVAMEVRSVRLEGDDASDFTIESFSTRVPPGESRSLLIRFEPRSRGVKRAVLHVESAACKGGTLDI